MGYWFRLHGAVVGDTTEKIAQKQIMGRFIERLRNARAKSFLENTNLINKKWKYIVTCMILLFYMKRIPGYSFCHPQKRVFTNIFLSKNLTIKFPTPKISQIANLNLKEGSAPKRQYYTWVLPWRFSLTFVFPCWHGQSHLPVTENGHKVRPSR